MADVEVPLVATRNLVGSVVRPKSVKVVSDHLSTTRSFLQLRKNDIISVTPDVVLFPGFTAGQVSHKILRITNVSGDPQRIHILPPSTSMFKIHYMKKGSLYPGLHLDVKISFSPRTWNYHYDCIRMHCSNENTLVVPVHAYPQPNVSKFPQKMSFPPTPLGQSVSKSFSLSSDVPVDFRFNLTELDKSSDFAVTPMEGVIPGNGKVVIRVTYTPVDYTTAVTKLQLDVSQYNWKVLTCTCVGTSSPGLAIEQQKKDEKTKNAIPLAPLERLKQQRMRRKLAPKVKESKDTVYQGYRVPKNMNSTAAVSAILNQEPGKLKASELRTSHEALDNPLGDLVRRQVREASFVQMVKERQDQERASQYKWVARIGDLPLSTEERDTILNSRDAEDKKRRSEDGIDVNCFTTGHKVLYKRTQRQAQEELASSPQFMSLGVDNWTRRRAILIRFATAARKVVIMNRCMKRLKKIKQAALDTQLQEQDKECSWEAIPQMKHENVVSVLFPHEGWKGKDSWGTIEKTRATEVNLPRHAHQRNMGLLELEVPVEYKLLGYQPHSLPLSDSYVLPGLARPLRSGAKEELEAANLHRTDVAVMGPPVMSSEERGTGESVQVVDLEESSEDSFDMGTPLVPPSFLHQLPNYPPLNVFIPCSNVNHSLPVLPHSEVELDSKLQPLPQFPTSDKEPVYMFSMSWKEDESPFIVTVEKARQSGSRPNQSVMPRTGFMEDFLTSDNFTIESVNNLDVS